MKDFTISFMICGMVAVFCIMQPELNKKENKIKKLEKRVKFCDSINDVNRVNDSIENNTWDPANEIIKKHLHNSK